MEISPQTKTGYVIKPIQEPSEKTEKDYWLKASSRNELIKREKFAEDYIKTRAVNASQEIKDKIRCEIINGKAKCSYAEEDDCDD